MTDVQAAIRQILSQSEADFEAEMKEKNETLDKTNAALKESGSSLAEERRRLEELRAKVREKDELEQKINNLRRSADSIRSDLSKNAVRSPRLQDNIGVGQADKGLDFDGRLADLNQYFPGGADDPVLTLTPDQANFLASLERAEVLSGRVKAYQQHNQTLENQARMLKARSSELEERYKKIISLCTGAEVGKVDELLDSLVQAVISEQKEMSDNMELGRVREFLRMVQGNEG